MNLFWLLITVVIGKCRELKQERNGDNTSTITGNYKYKPELIIEFVETLHSLLKLAVKARKFSDEIFQKSVMLYGFQR